MSQKEPARSGPVGPLELIKNLPNEVFAVSDGRWGNLGAVRYREQLPSEVFAPPSIYHALLLLLHAPKEFESRSEGIRRVVPPPAGLILFVPAGSPGRGGGARGVLGPEPALPPLQAPRRCHPGAVPGGRKNRRKDSKPRQEAGRRAA